MPIRLIALRALAMLIVLGGAAAPAAAQKRVLYLDYVGPNAHNHPSRVNARAAIQALAQTGGFTVTITADAASLTAETLAQYDAVVFFTCGDLTASAPLRFALFDYVASGRGFVGFHSATDSFHSWPEYGPFIGARFVNHGSDDRPGTIVVEDSTHVAMQGFTNPFTFTDEFYLMRGPEYNEITPFTRRDLHVLMHLDQATPQPARPVKQPIYPQLDDTDLPLAWTRQHGAGRVFYSALGHRPDTWDNPQFRAHALAAIRWALGDGDNDGLDDRWETSWGLRDTDATGVNGAGGDPDGDGRTNAQEQAAGTHPRGFAQRYLAEGQTGVFFQTRINVLNPNPTFTSRVQLRYQLENGAVLTDRVTLFPRTRRTITPPPDASFSTLIVSDQPVVADRTMTWGAVNGSSPYGSHAESALVAPAADWYFAEGATHAFDLFYLVQNPSDQAAAVDARFLRGPFGAGPPITRSYTVGAHQRLTVNVDAIPGLEAADVAADFHSTNGTPIIVERAMYFSKPGELRAGGTDGTGVTALGTHWFMAEGATGGFFDTFVHVANPNPTRADIHVTFQLPFGAAPIERDYQIEPLTRLTLPVEQVAPQLAGTSVSIAIASTNGVPVVAERSMWWPDGNWYEGHNTLATNVTGTAWAVADGETGGPDNSRTYILIASGSGATDSVRLLLCRDSGPPIEKIYTDALTANGRLTVDLGVAFPEIAGERVGVIVESMGQSSSGAVTPMPIVVERAMYSDANGVFWAAGSNLVATRLR
jgi:type 1 glutamine amidotransferase